MSTHEDLRVSVLTKASYQRWKFEVIACLKSVVVYEVVNGSEVCKKPEEVKEWQKKDAKAMRILSGGLSDDDHSAIRECTTSKAMFIKIKSLYKTKTEANKYLLNQAFHAMKFKDGQSVQGCSELAVIVQQLEAIGEKISDAALVAKVINDLLAKFDTFCETYYIQAARDRTIKFDDIHQQLILIESRRDETSSKSDSGDALITKSQKSSNDKKSTKSHEAKVNALNVTSLDTFEKTVANTKPELRKSRVNRPKQIKRTASR